MSRWFRWYEGTSEDGKFRVVARMSRVTVRDVIALWAFMLEDAAHLDHRGVCKRNEDFMASILDFDDGVVERILEAMENVSMISVGLGDITICNWDKRQFEGDTDPTAADRQRRKRDRDKTVSNASVTRDSHPPDTDTDTDTDTEAKTETEKKESSLRSESPEPVKNVKRETFNPDWPQDHAEQFWSTFPRKTERIAAMKALEKVRKTHRVPWEKFIAAVRNYSATADPQFTKHPATWLNKGCWEDQQRGTDGKRFNNGSKSNSSDFVAGLASVAADIVGDRGMAGPAPEAVPLGRVNIDG